MDIIALCEDFHVHEKADVSVFQRRARLLQSVWREEQGFEIGYHKSGNSKRALGSRLQMPWAKETLANYISDVTKNVVRTEVCGQKADGKLFSEPRIFNDLLSSQPLCFNLFAELQQDLSLASKVFYTLTDRRVQKVTGIEFEFSPGRRNPKYTNDNTAFDVYVCFKTPRFGKGFIGIEIKYHENLQVKEPNHSKRYDEIAQIMGCFKESKLETIRKQPLQQIWRDHLLAGIHRFADYYYDGFFVIVYPQDNRRCFDATMKYYDCLSDRETFTTWTLEEIYSAIKNFTDSEWIDKFYDRYLNFEKIDKYLYQ